MEDSKTLDISLEDIKISPELNPILKNLPKLRRQSNNFTCNLANTDVDADNSENLQSCGSVCVNNLKQQLIFNCEFCELKYGDLDNFRRHLHQAHNLFQLEEEPVKQNTGKKRQSSEVCTVVKKEPLEPPIDLPSTYFTEPLVSCGAVFIYNQEKFHLACGYCDCSKYDNLDAFEKHVRQQHNILEGARNELNVVPKVEVKKEVFIITEVVEPTEVKVEKEEPLEVGVIDIKQNYSDDEEDEDEYENEEREDDDEEENETDDEEFLDEDDEEFLDEDNEDEDGEEDESEDGQNTSKATKRKQQDSPSDEPSSSSSAKRKSNEPTNIKAISYTEDSHQDCSEKNVDNKLFECDICHKTFKNKFYLKNHLQIHTDEKHNCDICQRIFKTKQYLKRHMANAHSKEKSYECDICHKRFRNRQHVDTHKIRHLGEAGRNHNCQYCDKKFFHKSEMVIHQRRVHASSKSPYKCDICHKIFKSNSSLVDHEHIHLNEAAKQFNCEHCDKKFTSASGLNHHKSVHTSEKPFQCDTCQVRFRTQRNLEGHKRRRHMVEAVNNHKCKYCEKKYFYKHELVTHERVHTGERPHKCELCGKGFRSHSNLCSHKKTHMEEPEKVYNCKQCDKKFANSGGLYNHKFVHTNEKPFECDICHKHYKTKGMLGAHKQRLHRKEK